MRKLTLTFLAGAGALIASSAYAADEIQIGDSSPLLHQARVVCNDVGQCPVDTALALDLGGEDRDRLRDHLVEEFGELHCKLGHAVRIEPGLRRRSPKNGNISSIRRRLAANPSRK
jgi:hypothetical protein